VIARYLDRVVPQLTFIASTLVGVCIPAIPFAVPVVFGAGFAGAAEPLTLLMLALVLFFLSNLLAPIIVLNERTKAVGILNVIAAAVNIVGDIVLVGPAGMGISGAAVATCVSLTIVALGYLAVANDCVGKPMRFDPAPLLPLVAGVGVALAARGAIAVGAGTAGVLICAVLVQRTLGIFRADDEDLIRDLDMPPRLKRLALRGISIAAR
jgi:O-antigen/teichoic acid export membrane protein